VTGRTNVGTVFLVGAGPGSPDLITVRGQALLGRADVVLYDALSHPGLLAMARPGAELRNVGKRGGSLSPSQEWITSQLIELAGEGKMVVRLKGGDSFLFARGAEEAEALVQAGIPFEVVPGLSSPIGTSAYAGIPLTHRELSSSVSFITGTDREGKEWSEAAWLKIATATDTLCILMGMRRIDEICHALIRGGRAPSTPAAVIMWGARPDQRVCEAPLGELARRSREMGLSNPGVIIVGEVVSLRNQLSWFEKRPLFGRKILIPRPAHQAQDTANQVRERGAEAVVYPVIEIQPPPDREPLIRAAANVGDYDWLLFTSANGVDAFFEALSETRGDTRRLGGVQVGVIGPRTGKALERYGVVPDVVAEEFVAEGLVSAILQRVSSGRLLLPRAREAREELPRALREAGLTIDVVDAYETKPIGEPASHGLRRLFEDERIDTVLFTSSSMVKSTVGALGAEALSLLRKVTIASIGPITTQTACELGLEVHVTAREYTVAGLLDALAEGCAPSTDPS
jgi:uroporphyrinogen III methyltransferase/synthase